MCDAERASDILVDSMNLFVSSAFNLSTEITMNKIISTLLVCFSLTSAMAAPLSPNLVGLWRAEGNAEDSSRHHDGSTPFGIKYAPGKIGQAFDFDGKSRQRVVIPMMNKSQADIACGFVTIARVEDGEDCVLLQKVNAPDETPLREVDAVLQQAKDTPIDQVPAFRKMMKATRLPLPMRRLLWALGLNWGRQRANYFGSFGVTSVAPFGGGELHALGPGPFVLSYGRVTADQTIDVVIRWDHRITDAALIAKALTRLEQVLNTEIAAELRTNRQQTEPKSVRAVAT